MSHADKSALYGLLKEAEYPFEKHYREYTTDELGVLAAQSGLLGTKEEAETVEEDEPAPSMFQSSEPVQTYAGQHAYSAPAEEEPLRVDPDTGFVWYRDEVRKPANAAPRARRKLTYIDPGVEQRQMRVGEYLETFEVSGSENNVSSVKITMPSYQVGVYKDPKFPFKVHVYNDNRGFDLFDVEEFWGGADQVPSEVKRIYVANDLCYDMRTTVQAINAEYRRSVLKEGL